MSTKDSFSLIARYYDRIMHRVNYQEWAEYIIQIMNLSPLKKKTRLLDIACGTGTMALLMNRKGFEVYGFDRSLEMVKVARQKVKKENVTDVFLFAGDFRDLPVKDKEFHGVYSIFDSLNNVLDERELLKIFVRVHEILVEGGAFVFDLNTDFSLRRDWGNNTKVEESDDVVTIWRTRYEDGVSTLNFTVFVREDNKYQRIDAIFRERGYDPPLVKNLLKKAGFKAALGFEHFTLYEGTEKSSRVTYLAY